eukprot:322270-Rhodomonas_salina.3
MRRTAQRKRGARTWSQRSQRMSNPSRRQPSHPSSSPSPAYSSSARCRLSSTARADPRQSCPDTRQHRIRATV